MSTIKPISPELENVEPFELAQQAVNIMTNNINAEDKLTWKQKYDLSRLFQDRLLGKIDFNQTS